MRHIDGCEAGDGLLERSLVLKGENCEKGLGGICCGKRLGNWRS